MGDLISRSALIEAMKKSEEEYEKSMVTPSWWTAFSVIEKQPIAYDVSKVVAELEEKRDRRTGVLRHILDEAIDIVKRGGVE